MYELRRATAIKLLPLYDPEDAMELPVNLAPNTSFVRGTVLGQTTSAANAVQTLTVTGTPTGGSITITVVHPITGQTLTFDVPYNASTATTQAAIRATAIGANVTVTGAGVLPGNTHIFTFNTDLASMPVPLMTVTTNALTGGTTPAATIANTTTGVTANSFGTYADGGAGGLDTARCILAYDCVTDGGGNVTLGTVTAGLGERGYTEKYAQAYFKGTFKVTDLTGLTAAAVADLGRLLSGTYNSTDGVLKMN
jgi:hypothetical protein